MKAVPRRSGFAVILAFAVVVALLCGCSRQARLLQSELEKLDLGDSFAPAKIVEIIEGCKNPAEKKKLTSQAVERLIAKLGDGDWRVREDIAEALGRIGDARAVEPLIAKLWDEDWQVRKAAAEALGSINDSRAVEPLLAELRDGNSYVRKVAAEALCKIGVDKMTPQQQAVYYVCTGRTEDAAKIGAPAVEPLVAELGWNGDVSATAVMVLGMIGAPAVGPLIAKLDDQNWHVRNDVAEALGRIGDARAVEPLIAKLGDESEYGNYVRKAAAEALGRIGDARAVEPLIAELRDKNSDVRKTAAGALGRIGDARAVEPLIAKLEGNDDVRPAAVEALGRIGVDKLMPPQQAVYYVCTGKPNEAAKIGAPAVEPLIAKLDDWDFKVRSAATVALGMIGDARAVEPLMAELGDGDSDVRKAAVKALGKIGVDKMTPHQQAVYYVSDGKWAEATKIGAPAVEPLIAKLRDEDSVVRSAVAEALGKIGVDKMTPVQQAVYYVYTGEFDKASKIGAPAVEPLLAKLGDVDPDIRRAIAVALGKIGAPAVEPLIAKLGEKNTDVRFAVTEALGLIGAPAVEPLVVKLWDRNSDVRAAAVKALGKIGAPAVEPLIAKLGVKNPDVRYAVVEALGKIGDVRAVEPLIAIMGDRDSELRLAVAWALGRLYPQPVEQLLAKLGDIDPLVRSGAADSLGQIGAPAVEPLLAKLATATDSVVRRAAIDALGNTRDARAVGPVLARIDDPGLRPNVCRALTLIGAPALDAIRAAYPAEKPRPDWATLLIASCGDKAVATGISTAQWNSAFAEAQRQPEMLSTTLSAVSYAGAVTGINSQVEGLCLAYIRRGDIRIIPQLVTLLNQYGSVQLAEDYMNCGQGDLRGAGKSWCYAHGYNVGTGGGSHRATWGGN